jgi:hypothetical protein
MLRKLYVIFTVTLTVSALAPALSSAQAGKGSKVYNAFAYFYDEDPCAYFETYLDVFERSTRSAPGPMEHLTTIEFLSFHYDTCADVPVSIVAGTIAIPANAFHNQGLHAASLQASANFTDRVGGAIVPVLFDLIWTCDRRYIDNNSNDACAPVVLSGTVQVGSRNLLDSQSVQGELSIYKTTGHGSM